MIFSALLLPFPALVCVAVGALIGYVAGHENGFHKGYAAAIERVNRWRAERERTQ